MVELEHYARKWQVWFPITICNICYIFMASLGGISCNDCKKLLSSLLIQGQQSTVLDQLCGIYQLVPQIHEDYIVWHQTDTLYHTTICKVVFPGLHLGPGVYSHAVVHLRGHISTYNKCLCHPHRPIKEVSEFIIHLLNGGSTQEIKNKIADLQNILTWGFKFDELYMLMCRGHSIQKWYELL